MVANDKNVVVLDSAVTGQVVEVSKTADNYLADVSKYLADKLIQGLEFCVIGDKLEYRKLREVYSEHLLTLPKFSGVKMDDFFFTAIVDPYITYFPTFGSLAEKKNKLGIPVVGTVVLLGHQPEALAHFTEIQSYLDFSIIVIK